MRARRVDENLAAIVKAARAIGFLVNIRNDDFADCDVQLPGVDRHEAWEVKRIKGKFRPRQKEMRERGWIIWTIRTDDDVLAARKRFTQQSEARRWT